MSQSESHIWGKLAPELFQRQGPKDTGFAAMALMFEKWTIKPSKFSLEKWLEVEVDTCSNIQRLYHGPGSLDTSFAGFNLTDSKTFLKLITI